MKIGIYAWWNVIQHGRTITAQGAHTVYLRHFLDLTDGVRLFTTATDTANEVNKENLSDSRLDVINIPWNSWQGAWLHMKQLNNLLSTNTQGLDAIYVRLFDPCAWLLSPICRSQAIGLIYHIIGDPIAGIFRRSDWSLPGKIIRRLMFWPEEQLVLKAARRHCTLINGSELTEIYSRKGLNAETVISSTLDDSDFFLREDTCTKEHAVILYVGFLRPAKRLDVLIDAVSLLVIEGRKIILRVVGPGQYVGFPEKLKRQALNQGLNGRIVFTGYVPLGYRLNAEYRAADILAFPSVTEGSPRVLLESAANSLPIVTTNVGSVNDLFVDGQSAIIVPRGNAEAMARGIARYLDEPNLRKRCIINARKIARKHKAKSFISHIIDRLEENAKSVNSSNLT